MPGLLVCRSKGLLTIKREVLCFRFGSVSSDDRVDRQPFLPVSLLVSGALLCQLDACIIPEHGLGQFAVPPSPAIMFHQQRRQTGRSGPCWTQRRHPPTLARGRPRSRRRYVPDRRRSAPSALRVSAPGLPVHPQPSRLPGRARRQLALRARLVAAGRLPTRPAAAHPAGRSAAPRSRTRGRPSPIWNRVKKDLRGPCLQSADSQRRRRTRLGLPRISSQV